MYIPEVFTRGYFGTQQAVANIQPEEWRTRVHEVLPSIDQIAFAALLLGIKGTPTPSVHVHWWEKPWPSRAGTVTEVYTEGSLTTAYTTGATAGTTLFVKIPAADCSQLVKGQNLVLVKSTTGVEIAGHITGVQIAGASSFVTVMLLEDDTVDNDVAGADGFAIIGSAQAEGADLPDGIIRQPTEYQNQTQIFANSLKMTGTKMAEQERITPETLMAARQDAMRDHMLDIQDAMIFGRHYTSAENGQPKRFLRGIATAIAEVGTNVFDFKNTTETGFAGETWEDRGFDWISTRLEILSRYSPTNNYEFYCGTQVLSAVQTAVAGRKGVQLVMNEGARRAGIAVSEIETIHGVARFIKMPVWTPNANRRKFALQANLDLLEARPMRGRDTKYLPDAFEGKKAGIDGIKEGWRTEITLEYNNLEAQSLWKNMGDDNVN